MWQGAGLQSGSFWGCPCRLMRPQCGNLVIAASESSENFFFAVHVFPLSKERYRLSGFRNKLVTFALPFCHFLGFRRLFIFIDIFRICWIHQSLWFGPGWQPRVGTRMLISCWAARDRTGYRVLVACMLCLEAQLFEKAPARNWVGVKLKWFPQILASRQSSLVSSLKLKSHPQEVRYLGLPNCGKFTRTTFPASSPVSQPGTGGSEGLQPSADEGLQRWAEVAAQRGRAPRGARTAETALEGAGGPSPVSRLGVLDMSCPEKQLTLWTYWNLPLTFPFFPNA